MIDSSYFRNNSVEKISTIKVFRQFTTGIVSLFASDVLLNANRPLKLSHFQIEGRLFTCQQTAPLHLTGLVMVFKRISSKVTLSVVNYLGNILESNICIEICNFKKKANETGDFRLSI